MTKKLNYSYKKVQKFKIDGNTPTNIIERKLFCSWIIPHIYNSVEIIFLDETGINI